MLTNKPIEHTEGILAGLGLRGFFEVVVGGDSLPTRKPDPEGARAILGALGLRPESAVMVGDSDTDTRTARAAGLWSLGVATAFPQGAWQIPVRISAWIPPPPWPRRWGSEANGPA